MSTSPPPPPPGFGGPPPQDPASATPRAQVHDVRFAGYTGERTPTWTAPLTLAWWSLLRAFGRRRGWTSKFVPFALLGLALIPGVGVLTVRALLSSEFPGQELPIELLPYSAYLGMIGTLIVLWAAVVTPELVCPDIQARVTSLYFATAISPGRYVLGKWLASMAAMLGMTLVPVVVLWLGNVMFADSIPDALADDAANLPRIVGAGVIVAAFFSTLGLAVAAVTGRRAYAISAFVGLTLGSVVLAGVFDSTGHETLAFALSLVAIPTLLAQRLFEDNDIPVVAMCVSYAVVIVVSLIALRARFRVQP